MLFITRIGRAIGHCLLFFFIFKLDKRIDKLYCIRAKFLLPKYWSIRPPTIKEKIGEFQHLMSGFRFQKIHKLQLGHSMALNNPALKKPGTSVFHVNIKLI